LSFFSLPGILTPLCKLKLHFNNTLSPFQFQDDDKERRLAAIL
jgi:hypothetical protein